MKKLIFMLVFLFVANCYGTLSPSAGNPRNTFRNAYAWSGNVPFDKATLWAQAVEDSLDGSVAVDNLLFVERTSDPTLTEGRLYYDTTANVLKYHNGSSFQTLAAESGTVSLDVAYGNGVSITVDNGAVALTATDAANNTVFQVVQSDTGTALGIDINNAGSGNSIDIQGTSGNDIEGTDDSWSISIAGIFDGEALTGVTNSQGILFDTNNEIQFGDNSEDVAMVFTSNTVSWATDTSVDQMAFGVVDNLTGVGDIAFDAAASTITLTADAGTEDLTISQAGAVDASLILSSAGTSTTDALIVNTDTGSITINSADNLDIYAADDITINMLFITQRPRLLQSRLCPI